MLPKITTALAVFGLVGFQSQAQLTVQSGATFFMQTGSQVTVQGDVQNAGTLNNDGSLRVQGNYTNTGTYTGVGSAGILEMYGAGDVNLSPGSSSIANLTINKTAATDDVTLTASTTVTNGFTFTQGGLTTNPIGTPSVALISPATTPYTFAAGKEVVGRVRRTGWTAGVARVFNQPNMQVTTTGGTTPSDFTVNMIPNGDPTQAEREVKRVYGFANTGGSGFTADVRYPYMAGELNTNTEANLVPWRLVTAEWNARLTPVTRDAANDWVATTGVAAADLAQEWKLADPNYTMNVTANLRGPWTGAAMNTNISGILPLAQPYNTTPFNYAGTENVGAIPTNVVDWVLIEHRKPASGLPADALSATITGRQAGFLLNNGTVVGLDGVTPIKVPIAKQGTAFITVRHRNHLGVLSNAIASNATGNFTNDFTVLANSYKPAGSPSDPVVLLSGGVEYGLWAGDANKNGAVNVTDANAIKSAIAASLNGYQFTDVNMSNSINVTDVNLTKSTISLSGTGSGTNARSRVDLNNPNIKVTTNIPDPIVEN
ncbi:MAG TPA: dockerin type I repeat-containing protein [Ferruginibacter sp.]|nr:dockerin type I repeat-containing protein [Ferruginibacter sp.]HRE64216.1 dockerin type I repeat-containing protein [Ferruginibacter sp.]